MTRERESDVHAWLESFLRLVVSPLARFRPLARADFAAWLERPPAGKRLALAEGPATAHGGHSTSAPANAASKDSTSSPVLSSTCR